MHGAQLSFDLDVRVNVFEANIRLLGGLLSAHMLAQSPTLGPRLMPRGYGGGLLDLAADLGRRLLPAFAASPTGEGATLLLHVHFLIPALHH
jgi:mannosidase alpha-like ER degradation enhancer 1